MYKKNLQTNNPLAGGQKKFPLTLLPIFLFTVLLILTAVNLLIEENIDKNLIVSSPYNFNLSKYPEFKNTSLPQATANGIIIMDAETKKNLYEKNKNLRFSSASTTKIMTALTALEHFRLDDQLIVPEDSKIDSVIDLQKGDKFKFVDLMYAMMLPSDNRAASTIAQNYPGGEGEFVARMNLNAKKLNLKNTYFADPIGLLDDLNYSTPSDLAVLSAVAMEKEVISDIVSTKLITISDSQDKKVYELENLNILLGSNGIVGLKTGYTDLALDVLVTAKNYNGHLIIMVVMNSEDRFQDTLGLLSFISDEIKYLTIRP